MNIETLARKLKLAGFDAELITLQYETHTKPGIRVLHDYNGLYPDTNTLLIHKSICKAAAKYGFNAEPRGHYVATFIYKEA